MRVFAEMYSFPKKASDKALLVNKKGAVNDYVNTVYFISMTQVCWMINIF